MHDVINRDGRIIDGLAFSACTVEGYLATMLVGVVTRIGDQETGARSGRLLRSLSR
jgi:N-acyl-D-aspartate/D-glutamate deacylase